MKKELKVPKFKNEDEEFEFWANLDLSEYYDPSDMEPVSFPNLKPSTTKISLRMPASLLDQLKIQANTIDVPYQSYMKVLLRDGVRREMYKAARVRAESDYSYGDDSADLDESEGGDTDTTDPESS